MPKPLQGVVTCLLSIVLPPIVLLILTAVLPGHLHLPTLLLVGGGFGLLYGLEAGILCIYDLNTVPGWFALVVDLTWSLPNTVLGFVLGNPIYIIFGTPSRTASEGQGWIVFQGGSSRFGTTVLQTLGTVNLGGAGQHERMHLLQARLLGPLYIPLVAASYVITFVLQVLFTFTLGLFLMLIGRRNKPYLEPPASSAVGGFLGWIYYATPMELMAYSLGNP